MVAALGKAYAKPANLKSKRFGPKQGGIQHRLSAEILYLRQGAVCHCCLKVSRAIKKLLGCFIEGRLRQVKGQVQCVHPRERQLNARELHLMERQTNIGEAQVRPAQKIFLTLKGMSLC